MTTEDERWIVIDGRRWRRQDPAIPPAFATELVAALMAARRAVRDGRGDEVAVRAARDRVQAAKVALGERGTPWWDDPTDDDIATRAAATIEALLDHRGPDRSICPSDVARTIGGTRWRTRMDPVRDVVRRLATAGDVVVTQRGEALDPTADWRGPIRIRRP